MDVLYSLSASLRTLQTLWLLQAGSAPFALWLLVIAGFAFTQLSQRPHAMRWFLAALAITIFWEGGGEAVLLPLLTGLWVDGSPEVDLAETLFDLVIWSGLPFLVQGVAAICLLKSAFGEASSVGTPPAGENA